MSAETTASGPETFRRRRIALSDAVGAVPILLMGHTVLPRNFAANAHPFRQDSTFLYFLGLSIPDAVAVVESGGETTLYLPPAGPDEVLWHGPSPSWGSWAQRCGAEHVRPRDELRPGPYSSLPVVDPVAEGLRVSLCGAAAGEGAAAKSPGRTAGCDEALLDAVIALRLCRDAEEIAAIRRSIAASVQAHRVAMQATHPGVRDSELHALLEAVFAACGMTKAYESIVTARGEVLHGHAQGEVLRDGDLLLVDAGAEDPSGYAADITRTWPVSGRFAPRQAEVYDCVLEAQEAAIAATQVGVRYREVHLVAARILAQGLCDFGLLKGDVDGLVEQGAHAVFFPHGVGHLLGLDVHDMELFGDRVGYPAGRSRASQFGLSFLRLDRDLEAGMVVTIEPGIYVVPAVLRDPVQRDRHGDSVRWARAEEWIGFGGVRIEDDVLVGPDGPQVLSSALPRAREAIEALVGSGLSPARRLGLA